MKTKSILLILLICPLFVLVGRSVLNRTPASYSHSLTVNNRPIDYDIFTLNAGGVLAVVEGDLKVTKDKAMPYQSLLVQGNVVSQQAPVTDVATNSTFMGAEMWPSTWLRGELGDAQSLKRKAVPFRVSLLRDGKLLKQWPINTTETVESIELNEIWPSARLGDELEVQPVVGSTLQPKRVIKLKKVDPALLQGC